MDSTDYYVPCLEDIRVGYECEVRNPDYQGQSDGKEWKSFIFDKTNIKEVISLWEYFNDYRTLYLTKEQIIGEGWEGTLFSGMFNKSEFSLFYHNYQLSIWKDRCTFFDGECKSINEFRTIMKWLKIK